MVGMKKFVHQSLWFIVITTGGASAVSLIGGIGLQVVEHQLLPLVPLLIALPALNTMIGDYSTIIAAHAGDPFERSRSKKELAIAISWSVIINIVGVIALSLLLAIKRGYAPDYAFIVTFSLLVVGAILTCVAFMFFLTFLLDKIMERHRLNPDDILIPVVTSVSDVLMLGMIAFAAFAIF